MFLKKIPTPSFLHSSISSGNFEGICTLSRSYQKKKKKLLFRKIHCDLNKPVRPVSGTLLKFPGIQF